jgi:O-antigen/teichoic acid export membrane protein
LLCYLDKIIGKYCKISHRRRAILSNAGWLFLDKIFRMGISFFVGVAVARYLRPDRFGLYNYTLAFVTLFTPLAALGLENVVIRNLVRAVPQRNEILGTAFILRLAGSIAAFFLSVMVISIHRQGDHLIRLLVVIASAGILFQSFDVIDLWFQSQVSSKYTIFAKILAFVSGSIAKLGLIWFSASLAMFVWVIILENFLAAVGLVIASKYQGIDPLKWTCRLQKARELLRDSLPLIFSAIASMIYLRIDQIMLGDMVGVRAVGIYSVAVKLAEIWYCIPMVIVPSLFPSIVKARDDNEEVFYSKLQKLYNFMAFLGYSVAIPMTFLSNWLVVHIYGIEYKEAGPLLSVLVWAGLFINLGVARCSFLMAMNWTRTHLFAGLIGCIVNVVLNLILIPYIGPMGAVLASCVAYWFVAHGACFFYRPLFRTGGMLSRALIYPRIW